MQKLLGVNTNYKTIKSEKVGVLTGIIYMSPYNLSGKNVCPGASAGCAAACLNTAGRGAMNVVQAARLKKTPRFRQLTREHNGRAGMFQDRGQFMVIIFSP